MPNFSMLFDPIFHWGADTKIVRYNAVYMLFHLTLHVRRQMGGSRGGPPPSLHEMPIPFYIHWDRNIIVTLVLSLYRKIVGTTVSVLNKCRHTNKGVMLREHLQVG